MSAIRRPYGGDHEFGFDTLGRANLVRERVDGQWLDTTVEYDLGGRKIAEIDSLGRRRSWRYDRCGNQIEYIDRDGKVLWLEHAEKYQRRSGPEFVLAAVERHLD